MTAAAAFPAEKLNRECVCSGADLPALRVALERELSAGAEARMLTDAHAHLYSSLPVFVSREQLERMAAVIDAVETVVALPAYRDAALGWAPGIARHDPGAPGVFYGYDFHLGADGPQLIEINTNAGGALLNAALGRAQRPCCDLVAGLATGPVDAGILEERVFEMFLSEWHAAGRDGRPDRIAIVDDAPTEQYLYPEFVLFRRLFEARGVAAAIVDPAQLEWRAGTLRLDGRRIDLVYNRLTDFYFEGAEHAALRAAYLAGAAVVTPHPRGHALHANKRNLALLTDLDRLRAWHVSERTVATLLAGIPRTRSVAAAEADALWAGRKALFFKPAAGYGSRGSYRGDKLTRKTFAEILAGDYVAQAFAPPSERAGPEPGGTATLRVDVRNYVYAGAVQLLAARLYQGQTTNFRTPGGGFAPVFYPTA